MRILLVHNHYGSSAPSGENEVFRMEKYLLESHGHDVLTFEQFSDELRSHPVLGRLKGAMVTPWNPLSAHKIKQKIATFKPDVVHAHNTFPLISPSIFRASRGVGRVLTLHNYRLLCPNAIPMRDGNVCTQCLSERSVLPALKYGCYRGSKVATFPLAINVALNRWLKTWQCEIDAFIALSDFQKQVMGDAGLPSEKIYVKPNFYPGTPNVVPSVERKNYVVFVGRVSQEKGVKTLIKAWRYWGSEAPELRIVGDGPLCNELAKTAVDLPVKFLGHISSDEAQRQIKYASLLVLPSEWFEGFPMVIREAFAFGTPVAASAIGPLPHIVRDGHNGKIFQPKDHLSLYSAIKSLFDTPSILSELGANARMSYEELYNQDANYQMLINIYMNAIENIKS